MGAKKADHGLDAQLVKDIDTVFDGDGAICDSLDFSRETWHKLNGNNGVKKEKCLAIVKAFFNFLSDDDNEEDDGVYDAYFKQMRDKYAEDRLNHNFAKFVMPLDLSN